MKVLTLLRPENLPFMLELHQQGCEMWDLRDAAVAFRRFNIPVQPVDIVSCADGGSGIEAEIKAMANTVEMLHTSEGIDALVVWTDAIPYTRAAVIAAKHLGIPTFEITHGFMNTYRQGHFECKSYVDHILSPGEEEVDFRKFYGQSVEVVPCGKPQWDSVTPGYIDACRDAVRDRFSIPGGRPIVLYGTTWRHQFSTWENDGGDIAPEVFEAHMNLRTVCNPFLIVKPHYSVATKALTDNLRNHLGSMGVTDFAVITGDSQLFIPACDLLVSHKSSLLVEGVLMDKPTVGFDFRERNDFAFYWDKGIAWEADPGNLMHTMSAVLLDKGVKRKMTADRPAAKWYFNNACDGHAAQRCVDAIRDRI